MDQIAKTAPKLHGLSGLAFVQARVSQFSRLSREWADRRRSRIALSRLGGHLIRDIGLDATACEDEVRRPFWR